jgi:hypothetical protein
MTTKLIISGGKLAEPSAPFSLYAEDFLDEQFGEGLSASAALHLQLGWIDEQGKVVGNHATDELLGMKFDSAFVRPLKLFEQLGLRAIGLGLRRVEGEIPGYPFDHVAYTGTAEQLQEALSEAGIKVEVRAHLFTRSEHLILSSWLRAHPNEARESLGAAFTSAEATYSLTWEAEEVAKKFVSGYSEDRCLDAAVATILLRSIERSLPNWGAWSPETGVISARKRRPRKDYRRLHLVPRQLFTINWASSAPGFSWPNRYNLTWVPLYKRYVVTVSADSPEGLCGYTDLALGSFPARRNVEDCVNEIVVGDWQGQAAEWNQEQWTDVLEEGLISTATLMQWAAEVWGGG